MNPRSNTQTQDYRTKRDVLSEKQEAYNKSMDSISKLTEELAQISERLESIKVRPDLPGCDWGIWNPCSNARRLTFAYFAAVLEEDGSVGLTEEFDAVDPIFVWSLNNGPPFVGELLSLGFLLLAESCSARDETHVTLMRTFVWHFCQHLFTVGVSSFQTAVQFSLMACFIQDVNKREGARLEVRFL
jgi:hypothetical protein